MANDKLYYPDDDYNEDGFYPDESWGIDSAEWDDIYYPDVDYPEDIEPVIVQVPQSLGKKRIDLGDKLPEYKKEKVELRAKTTNRQNGRKKQA